MLGTTMRSVCALLLRGRVAESSLQSTRGIARIPHYEYHIRFDPRFARKRPAQDVLDRLKRLNNGMWIRAHPGRNVKRYAKNDIFQQTSYLYETCTREECEMFDRMMSPFWLRRKHYLWNMEPTLGLINDPYEVYNVRHGIDSPRVDYKGRFVRERRKVLLDDTTSDKHFNER